MKKITTAAMLILVISLVLTSCGKPEEFKPAPIITTTETTTEEPTYKYSDFELFSTRMGMSIEETQKALGVQAAVYTNDNGTVYFTVNKRDLDFVADGYESSVYFIYNGDLRLCEVQYLSTEKTGFVLKDAVSSYDKQYGKHAVVHPDASKTNYVWYKDGVYLLITTVSNGQNAMSFFEEDYFEKSNPEEANAYAQL